MLQILETIIVNSILILAPLFFYRAIKEKPWKETIRELIGKYQGHKKEIIGGVALFFALLIGFFALSAGITVAGVNDLEKVERIVEEEYATNFVGFAIAMVIGVFAEEFFFRAFLVRKFGIWISTITFAAVHIGYESSGEVIGVFFLGLILAYWYKRNKSLFQNYLGHFLYNIVGVAFYLIG